jgi:long-chain fatty acid transport protein
MRCGLITKSLLAGTMLATMLGAAQAGGFARGTADTDILYEPGNFDMRAGVTFVNPSRKFSDHEDLGLVGKDYTSSYAIPSFAFKLNIVDPLRCAGTYTQAYGGSIDYTGREDVGKLTEDFAVDEFGLTCAGKFAAGRGNFYVIGGVFQEYFNYERTNSTPLPGQNATLELSGQDTGYRLGVAYDIPDIAFRTQLLYRSGTSYGADGTLTVPGAILMSPAATVALDAMGYGNLPQSVRWDIQSGIAPGWLAFASVKWTDWSVQEQLIVDSGVPALNSEDDYFWKDGWTITGGVGHAFNDKVSGLASLTWDQGVGTGYDLSSDTWTVALGASMKDGIGGELRGGVGVSYLTSASAPLDTTNNPSVGSGWAYAFNVGYKLNW